MMTWEETIKFIKNNSSFEKLVLDCYYDDPISLSAWRFYHSNEWKATQKIFFSYFGSNLKNKKLKVLDVGAGRGISSFALAYDGFYVTALEPSTSEIVGTNAIKTLISQTNIKNIKILNIPVEKLNKLDYDFDMVYLRQALHHANNLQNFCYHITKFLKPNGLLIIAREHILKSESEKDIFLNNHPLHKYYGGENAYTLSQYLNALKKAKIHKIKILKTFDSEINVYHDTFDLLKKRLEQKFKIKMSNLLFNLVLKLMNYISYTPGTLYTFIGVKK